MTDVVGLFCHIVGLFYLYSRSLLPMQYIYKHIYIYIYGPFAAEKRGSGGNVCVTHTHTNTPCYTVDTLTDGGAADQYSRSLLPIQ